MNSEAMSMNATTILRLNEVIGGIKAGEINNTERKSIIFDKKNHVLSMGIETINNQKEVKMSKFERFRTEYLNDAIQVSLKTFIRGREDRYMDKHKDGCYQFPAKRISRFIDNVFAVDGGGKDGLYHPHFLSECWDASK